MPAQRWDSCGIYGDEIERGVRTLGFASDFIRVKDRCPGSMSR